MGKQVLREVDVTCQRLPSEPMGEQGNPHLCFDAPAYHQIVSKALKPDFGES